MSNQRWIALHCGEESDSLVRNHPNAFLLLTQIAMRAKWKDCPITKLKAGQAFVGDWKNAGLHSEMAYRHAKKVLTECCLATFQGTSKGTVANLSSSMIFSYSAEPRNGQCNRPATDQQQTRNGQGTTNHTDTQKHGYTEHTDTTKEEPPFSDMFANTQPSQPLAKPTRPKKMVRPTLEEILEYGKTLDPPFTKADPFLAHYDSNGWLVGKNPMKDWKATVRKWNMNEITKPASAPPKKSTLEKEYIFDDSYTTEIL